MATKKNLLMDTLPLLFICFTAVLGIYALGNYFQDTITRNRHLPILEISAEILPLEYDNDLPADRISFDLPSYFGTVAATDVFRARRDAEHGEGKWRRYRHRHRRGCGPRRLRR